MLNAPTYSGLSGPALQQERAVAAAATKERAQKQKQEQKDEAHKAAAATKERAQKQKQKQKDEAHKAAAAVVADLRHERKAATFKTATERRSEEVIKGHFFNIVCCHLKLNNFTKRARLVTKWIDEIKPAELKSHEQASLDEILLGDEIEKLSIADAGLKQSEVVFFD